MSTKFSTMHVSQYLNRIGFAEAFSANKETLFALHKSHVLHVPFENLDIIGKIPITLDQDRFCNKIVAKRRGGICYELNGAFKYLLDAAGFDSFFISCNVFVPTLGIYGADFGHIALITNIGGEQYLLDVGFGDGFIEPLKLVYNTPQRQYGTYYRFRSLPAGEVLLEKSADDKEYQQMFKFTRVLRTLSEFSPLCEFHQFAPQAPFNKQALCTRPTLTGRITLSNKSLSIKKGKEKQDMQVATPADFDALLEQLFNIRLEPCVQ